MSGFLGGGIGPTAIKRHSSLAAPVPVAGAELLTNGDFAAWTGDNPDGWVVSAETGTEYVTEAAGKCRMVTAGNLIAMTQAVLTPGLWYRASLTVSAVTGNQTILFGAINTQNNILSPGMLLATGRAADVSFQIKRVFGAASDATFDDASCRGLTLASVFSSRAYASTDCDLSVGVTRTAGTQAGLVARLDSAASPANFLIAYENGAGRVRVDKCVAGTYTNIIDGAVAYAAGRVLRLVCSGNDVSCYYHGTQVGTTQTVSDAGIVSNVRHGLFSTYAANTFSGYTAA